MGTETNKDERNNPEYLAQLLKDKKQIQAFPNVFIHLEKLLDEGKFWADNSTKFAVRIFLESILNENWRFFQNNRLTFSK